MVDALRGAATVDEVVTSHNDFLDACLKECLLTNHDLVKVCVYVCVSFRACACVCTKSVREPLHALTFPRVCVCVCSC